MKLKDTYIQTSGVMRCCISSVAEEYFELDFGLGATSSCKHCGTEFTLIHNGKNMWMPNWQLGLEDEQDVARKEEE